MVQPTADPTIDGVDTTRTEGRTWFGHPRQLARLFSTEAMERFGFYGMRALLTLYLAEHFLFRDTVAAGLYGAFTSLVYLTPLFGGLLADRILGSKRSVKFGAIMMALGYFGLCFGGEAAKPYFEYGGQRYEVQSVVQGETRTQYVVADGQRYQVKGNEDSSLSLLGAGTGSLPATIPAGAYEFDGERNEFWVAIMLLSLSSIVIGNGFFKPNISTIVGTLYAADDRRRDAGFTIFYMGINLGSLVSQFFCPLFAVWFGWWAGFLLAASGMVVSFLLFQFDRGLLADYGNPPSPEAAKKSGLVLLAAVLFVPLVWFLLFNQMENAAAAASAAREGTGILGYFASLPVLGQVLFAVFLLSVIGIPIWAWRVGTREEFQMMLAAVVLTVFSVVFWTLFEQAGSSMTLFAERSTDRSLGFYTMPAAQVQIFNPLFIVFLAPVFSALWVAMAKRRFEPSIPIKFSIGLVLVGAGFLALVFGAQFAGPDFQVALGWLAFAYLLHSIGELCLSPVGLSMITKLSIARVVGLMMGVWFMCTAVAQYVGGMVAQFAAVETVGGEVTNPALALSTYVGVFQTIGWWSIGFGVLLLLLSPVIKRWMHGVN